MNFDTRKLALLAATMLLVAGMPGTLQAGGKIESEYKKGNFPKPTIINNQYWPLIPGTTFTYAAEEDDECQVNTFYVSDPDDENDPIYPYNEKEIDGLKMIVLYDVGWVDEDCDKEVDNDEVEELTFDWHVQDKYGRVWYFGEESYDCEDGECEINDGSWEAFMDVADSGSEADPGIIMLANPRRGDQYDQEFYEDFAEDKGKVQRLNAWVTLYRDDAFPPGNFHDCLKTKEWTPLEHGHIEHKWYCPSGGGLLAIDELKGKTVRIERVLPVVLPFEALELIPDP
jgi:hypothetical protein